MARESVEFRLDLLEANAGASTFLALTDTPAAYTGQSLKVVRVNAGETSLEFVTLAGGGDMLAANNLSDVSNVATARTNLGLNTTANQTDSTDKRFMTDAQEAKLDAITGSNTGDQTSIVGISGTKTQFNTACTDGDFLFDGSIVGLTDGDKGDITVSGSGTVWNIDAATIGTTELSATGTPSSGTFLRGDNTWAAPTDPAGWTTIVKSANQDVTNNATLQDDTALQFSVVAGGHYMVEILIATGANSSTGDYKFAFAISAGAMTGVGSAVCRNASNTQSNTAVTAANATVTTSIPVGQPGGTIDTTNGICTVTSDFGFYCTADATFKFQFAQNTAGVGTTARTWKGSILRYKRLD
jgi:hypothetical protein